MLFTADALMLFDTPTRMTSRVASWIGMSDRCKPRPMSSSSLSTRGEPRNMMELDSGRWSIWPLSSITWKRHTHTHTESKVLKCKSKYAYHITNSIYLQRININAISQTSWCCHEDTFAWICLHGCQEKQQSISDFSAVYFTSETHTISSHRLRRERERERLFFY